MKQIYYTQCPIGYGLGASNGFQIKRLTPGYPISGDFRYRGDEETYDDLDNANLMRVIERRKGLPVALGILYLYAARSQGSLWIR